MEDYQNQAAQLLNQISDMEWQDAINHIVAAIINARELGYALGWSASYERDNLRDEEIASLKTALERANVGRNGVDKTSK
jgi:hypothetical protein